MARKTNKEDSERAEAVIDPALRDTEVPSSSRADKTSLEMSSSPRRHLDNNSPPPPIATIPNSHSPSPSVVSVDRSSNNTPHIRRSPPMPPVPVYSYHERYRQDHPPPPINPHHHSGYLYAPPPPPPFDPRYDHHHAHYQQPHHLPEHPGHHYSPSGLPTHYIPHSMPHPPPPPPPQSTYGHHYPMPGQPPVSIVHTSDANTKLTDGIRRRCFNCCTTDTSTWRRSNLSPGKVLCNKCGLFERTHSRPRPEQFPHKRGALAASNLRGRTPPSGAGSSNQLPPISAATGGPYPYHHSSLTPLTSGPGGEYPPPPLHQQHPHSHSHPHPSSLPGLQSWHGHNTSSGSTSSSASAANGANGNNSANGNSDAPPLLRRALDSPRMNSSSTSSGSGGGNANVRTFEEPLAADPHARSHPPSPPLPLSKSSTGNHHPPSNSRTPPSGRDSQV